PGRFKAVSSPTRYLLGQVVQVLAQLFYLGLEGRVAQVDPIVIQLTQDAEGWRCSQVGGEAEQTMGLEYELSAVGLVPGGNHRFVRREIAVRIDPAELKPQLWRILLKRVNLVLVQGRHGGVERMERCRGLPRPCRRWGRQLLE